MSRRGRNDRPLDTRPALTDAALERASGGSLWTWLTGQNKGDDNTVHFDDRGDGWGHGAVVCTSPNGAQAAWYPKDIGPVPSTWCSSPGSYLDDKEGLLPADRAAGYQGTTTNDDGSAHDDPPTPEADDSHGDDADAPGADVSQVAGDGDGDGDGDGQGQEVAEASSSGDGDGDADA